MSGATATNVIWTEDGLSGPGSLTVTNQSPGSLPANGLFDTANAQGHFAVDKNIGNEGPWSVTIPIALSGADVTLESLDLDWQHFDNSGNFQGTARNVRWTITVTGSSSGLVGTGVATASAVSGLQNVAFSSPLDLSSSETYDVEILVDSNSNAAGNNTGFDGLIFNGEVVPEPSSVLLVFAGLGLAMRRRR